MIGQTLGHYRIIERIGAGGMGVVYRALDQRLDRDVALKVLPSGALADEVARRRFRKEALALAKLNHPNIAGVYDFDSQDGMDFLVMEYLPGLTLAEQLATGGLQEKQIVSLGSQVTAALEEAHDQRVVHRDLKPGNIIVTPKGQVKVLDFGLATLLHPGDDLTATQTLTQTPAASGTLPYMAPEQMRGEQADVRTDIYAACAVLYEMATGQRVFPETHASRLVNAILTRPPTPPSTLNREISPGFDSIILKALDKDPERRYQSAKELRVDLERLTTPALSVAPQRGNVLALSMWALAVGVVMLALLVGFNVRGWRDRLFSHGRSRSVESLAVLPLANLSGDPTQDYFADGMTEALITDMSKISALRVISRTSVMHFKGTQRTLPEIARELNVDAVVEGSVLRSGDRVRITAQLIEGSTDRHLWANSYERDLRDVLALQSDVASAIAKEIQVKLTPGEQVRLANSAPVNPEAHEAYLKGLYYFNEGRDKQFSTGAPESFVKGIEYFEQAIKIDPNYALAYSGLARSYHWLAWLNRPELYAKSKEAAKQAVQIDDTVAEAHAALAYVMFIHDWDWKQSEAEFRRAIELNPSYGEAHHGYALHLQSVGRVDEAIGEINKAIDLDPLTLQQKRNAAGIYTCAGRYDLAIEKLESALQLYPNSSSFQYDLGNVYIRKKMFADGLAVTQRAIKNSRDNPKESYPLAWAYAVMGNRSEATHILEQLKKPSKEMPNMVAIASICAALGDKDQAFAWLEKAYYHHSDRLTYIKCVESVDSLDSDPRFQALLDRMGLPR
jgi:TolB-like protein/Tfp pilus assembly protein PilF/predicted Ser/Thr protein kinase